MRFARWVRRRFFCKHPRVRMLYGDAIVFRNGKRWECTHCGKPLMNVPPGTWIVGREH